MERLCLICVICLLWAGVAVAQSGRERKEQAEKKAAEERLRSPGGFRIVDSASFVPRAEDREEQETNEGPGESDASAATNGDQEGGSEERSSMPQFTEKTTSGSGSPAILSSENGRGRDGTGNVQRASYNMAGSPVPGNLRLDATNEDTSREGGGQVRKQGDQPHQSPTSQAGAKATQDDKDAKDKSSGKKEKREERRRARKNN